MATKVSKERFLVDLSTITDFFNTSIRSRDTKEGEPTLKFPFNTRPFQINSLSTNTQIQSRAITG